MAFCANCGRVIADSADFCPNCGHPNEAKQAASVQTQGSVQPQVVPAAPFAGWWRRFLARLIDGLIISVPLRLIDRTGNGLSLLGLVYEWLMLGLNDGRTIGKMVMGVRIANPDGSTINLGQAAIRTAMSIVSALVFLLGFLWAAWDSENRTWHDIVANTRAFKV